MNVRERDNWRIDVPRVTRVTSNSFSLNLIPSNSPCTLVHYIFSESQHVRLPLLRLWVSMPDQHTRTALSDESILRWRISQLRSTGTAVRRCTTRRTSRSDGLRISTCHQVYLPQIWIIGNDTDTRFALYSTFEQCQRKDVHIHLVLVPHSLVPTYWFGFLQSSNNLHSRHKTATLAIIIEIALYWNMREYK